jgi:hypothetical protein
MTELHYRQVVAKKPHRCSWCPEKISPGEPIISRASIFDGGIQSDYFHKECALAFNSYDWNGETEYEPQFFRRGSHEKI